MEDLQKTFLQQVEQKLPKGQLLVRELMDALHISKSEAYNKVKGKNQLNLSQIQLLCIRMGINFTIPGVQQQQVSEVSFMPFRTGDVSVNAYIESLKKILSSIASAKNRRLTCATDDVPIFHLFAYPELTAFKLHFWQMRSIENAPFIFDFDKWDASILEATEELHSLYQTVPSVEVWTKSSLLNTVEQIKYAKTAGIITDSNMGKLICQQLRNALADIEKYALNRSKNDSKISFDWYFYDIIGSITYLAEMDGKLMTFLRFNTFNTMQSYNQPICQEVQDWLQKLIADSIGFSGQGSVYRNRYLAAAYESCDELLNSFR